MTRLVHKHRLSLLAVLLLCLSWSVWLQGNHVHVAEHSAIDACVVCHYNAASLPSTTSSPDIIRTAAVFSDTVSLAVFVLLVTLRPPARAPPAKLIV
ncbi:hypothetical protein [uncultured Zhongshania sp.]|uniref:hypothetical protein n=1 Tax=uncultured Zhongshania sp. TaxID=1642288 RepID=UPI0030D8016C|tara:strand:- start:4831 stop:5121 length:291 start_codon:yes stop_codon:yes gene_type:complete